MTDKLSIKINNQIVEVTMDDNGRYCLNDLFKASGGNASKAPQKFLRSQHEIDTYRLWDENDKRQIVSCQNLDNYVIQMKINRATKTFGSRKTALKYAMFIDKNFYEAVVEAFDKLSTGDVQEAANIASEYTLTPEIISKYEKTNSKFKSIVKDSYEPEELNKYYMLYYKLICKVVSGYHPKQMTGGFGSMIEHIKSQDHLPAMNGYIAAMEIVMSLLNAGITDYHTVASILQVRTSKNKHLMTIYD